MLKTKPEIKKREQQVRNNIIEKDERAQEETWGGDSGKKGIDGKA